MTTKCNNFEGAPCGGASSWDQIDWPRCERYVERLQSRIVKAVQENRFRQVRSLQRLVVRSFAAKALAVKRVTSNRGKRTAGVDGETWRSGLSKIRAIGRLTSKGYKPLPLRRIYVPKSNGGRRPLGIPTMRDRAMQALYLLALDPVAETLLDKRMYGFRKARSTKDAIERCFKILRHPSAAPWILEGDIKGCFDHISHKWLLTHVPMNTGMLHKWLKAGVLEQGALYPTEEGTPQGGIISPTLMNLTLNGMSSSLRKRFPRKQRTMATDQVYTVVYADDFVVTAKSQDILEETVLPFVSDFLGERGLGLSMEKTHTTHIDMGFDFLGQNIRKYGGKLMITPSAKSQKALMQRVSDIIAQLRSATQEQLISSLNPVLRGWANYHRHVVSKQVFVKLDNWLWKRLWQWACRRHPNKRRTWIKDRYFHVVGSRRWVFRSPVKGPKNSKTWYTLLCMADTPIRRHTMIRRDANPYDPKWRPYFDYRARRKTRSPMKDRKPNRRVSPT